MVVASLKASICQRDRHKTTRRLRPYPPQEDLGLALAADPAVSRQSQANACKCRSGADRSALAFSEFSEYVMVVFARGRNAIGTAFSICNFA